VRGMKRLKDYSKIGTVSDVKNNLKKLEKKLPSAGGTLSQSYDLGLGCRVYTEIARSTAEQIQLLTKHIEEPIEITANICRTVFEINIIFRYCFSSTNRPNRYADQTGK